jgi:hypothetical protein
VRSKKTATILEGLRERDDVACQDAATEIERLHEHIKKLERRIHNQRASNRITWEIVEMRRKWLGSDTARAAHWALLKRYRRLLHKHEGVPFAESMMSD